MFGSSKMVLFFSDFPLVFISPDTLSFLYRDFAAGICNKISEMIQGTCVTLSDKRENLISVRVPYYPYINIKCCSPHSQIFPGFKLN